MEKTTTKKHASYSILIKDNFKCGIPMNQAHSDQTIQIRVIYLFFLFSASYMNIRMAFISSVVVLIASFILISIPHSLTHPPSLSLCNDVHNVALVSSLDLILMWHLCTHTVFFCLSQQHKKSLFSHTHTPPTLTSYLLILLFSVHLYALFSSGFYLVLFPRDLQEQIQFFF